MIRMRECTIVQVELCGLSGQENRLQYIRFLVVLVYRPLFICSTTGELIRFDYIFIS